MSTTKNRIMISLNGNDLTKLENKAREKHTTKSEIVAEFLSRKQYKKENRERHKKVYRELDSKKINECLKQLQKINNNLSSLANNLNQYQHQINLAMLHNYFDVQTAQQLKSSYDLMLQVKLQKEIEKTVKDLTKYVNY